MATAHKKNAQTSTSFRLLVEYDGTRYQGWQRQGQAQSAAGVKTIAGTLDRILFKSGVKILNLMGAGRTDAGVHALGQVAHLHTAKPFLPSELRRILEDGLPYDIAVPRLESCPPDFDAREDAVSRSYIYQIALRKSAFAKSLCWWPKRHLDVGILKEVWSLFEGNQIMTAFADLKNGENPRCQIYSCRIKNDGQLLLLGVTARFFLRRQVRRMVGAAVQCALGETKIARIHRDLKTPTPDSVLYWAERTAPAAGLFLESVCYSHGEKNNDLRNILRVD